MKIGIIGVGFVGKAVLASYADTKVEVICRDPAVGYDTAIGNMMHLDAIFVCVPSPSNVDGSCDTSILESVLDQLTNYKGVIISKVTAPPDVYARLQDKHANLVYCPEFLTAANAVWDYKNSQTAIIGGNSEFLGAALEVITEALPRTVIMYTDIKTASLTKYTVNSFLATKVAFMNEIHDVAVAIGVDYKKLTDLVVMDPRIGSSHMKVPGQDGFGFAGACFPKDTKALSHFAQGALTILDQAIAANEEMRKK